MESFNQTALSDILVEMAAVIERLVKEQERIVGAIYEDDRLRERYLAGVMRPDAETHESAIRVLRQRLISISQELRKG